MLYDEHLKYKNVEYNPNPNGPDTPEEKSEKLKKDVNTKAKKGC